MKGIYGLKQFIQWEASEIQSRKILLSWILSNFKYFCMLQLNFQFFCVAFQKALASATTVQLNSFSEAEVGKAYKMKHKRLSC